jgi:putative tryptophan/tyrosine transport system substrate-binding protein
LHPWRRFNEATLLLALAAASLTSPAVWAKSPAPSNRVMRLGILGDYPSTTEEEFRQAMSPRGWEVGRNLIVELRFAMGKANLQVLAQELVDARVDVIFADGDRPAVAAFNSTRSIPIVMHATDPVAAGMAKSLASPGGNVTGMVYGAQDYAGKQLDLLRAIQPGLKRMGAVFVPGNVALEVVLANWEVAAAKIGVTMVRLPRPRTVADIDETLAAALRDRVQAIDFSFNLALPGAGWQQVTAWAIRNKVLTTAAAYHRGEAAVTFGANGPRFASQLLDQLDRVLRGAKPADVPIQQPMVFDTVINRRIIQAMGLTVPRSVLLQATEVID